MNLGNLRIADLELFISAARLKNLGKAALLHHLSQSAASAAIQRVEAAFGKALCTHEKRQFRLTFEGCTLLPRAEEWVKQLKDNLAVQRPLPLRIATTHAIARVAISAVLAVEQFELSLIRPDRAYGAVMRNEADLALVLDNAPWEGVIAAEIGKGAFQLYSRKKNAAQAPVLLPEDQIEVLTLQQRWQQVHGVPLEIKARVPSWSLIADICSCSHEIGFLPDFLAQSLNLRPVSWQPAPSRYRVLLLFKKADSGLEARIEKLISAWEPIFSSIR